MLKADREDKVILLLSYVKYALLEHNSKLQVAQVWLDKKKMQYIATLFHLRTNGQRCRKPKSMLIYGEGRLILIYDRWGH